jgi:rod shape-determining protein MreB
MAAAIGADLPIEDAEGVFIVDIGGGTSEIAIISLGGIVLGRSVRVAGDEMDEAIIAYVRLKYSLLLGQPSAEKIKMTIGSAASAASEKESEKFAVVRGRDLETGLPKSIKLSSEEVREALAPVMQQIVGNIKDLLEEAPPELVSDIMQRGIYLAGGGALLAGIDEAVADATQMSVHIAEDPITCVVRGCGKLLENPSLLAKIKITSGLK